MLALPVLAFVLASPKKVVKEMVKYRGGLREGGRPIRAFLEELSQTMLMKILIDARQTVGMPSFNSGIGL